MTQVLIIDDDSDSRELLRFTLTSLGCEVFSARDGADGLECALASPPDIIFSDILMPEMDGFELCQRVKTDPRLRHIPFVFYTATYVTEEDEQLAMDLGGAGFIRKGTDSAQFVDIVKDALKNVGIRSESAGEQSAKSLGNAHEKSVSRKLFKKINELNAERESRLSLLELTEAVVAAAMNAVIAVDPAGKIILWNRSASEMFGYGIGEALGQDLHALLVPEALLSRAKLGFEKFRQTGEGPLLGKRAEFTAQRKDGSQFPVALNLARFRRDGRWHAAATLHDISERKAREHERAREAEKLTQTLISTIGAISATLAFRDPYTAGHQSRVADLCSAIGQEMGLGEDQLVGLRLGAMIHDIGKIALPAEILVKPSRLTETEFALIKEHSRAGYEIVKDVDFPWPIAEMILQHHERLDGSGYPHGCKGKELLLESRIIGLADVVEAMSSHRPYRASLGMQAALEQIQSGRGSMFDPDVVDACVRVIQTHDMHIPEVSETVIIKPQRQGN